MMYAPPPVAPFMVIDVRPGGEVEAMHRDAFNLSFLGHQSIRRASELKFDEQSQDWYIQLLTEEGDGLAILDGARGFESYEDARKMEVRWLEMCRLHAYEPMSPEGVKILGVLRNRFE